MYSLLAISLDLKSVRLVIQKQIKNAKIIALTSQKKEISFPSDKIIFVFPEVREDLSEAYNLLIKMEKEFLREKETFLEDKVVEQIYNLLSAEENLLLAPKDILEYFYSETNSLQVMAFIDCLLVDSIYFYKAKDWFFQLAKASEIEEKKQTKLLQEEKKRSKEFQDKEFYETISSILREERTVLSKSEEDKFQDYLKHLKFYAIYGEESSHKSKALDIMKMIYSTYTGFKKGGNPVYNTILLLIKLGLLEEDENLLLEKLDIPLDFEEEALKEAKEVEFSPQEDVRKNLSDLYTFSIDGDDTKDFDDAISFIKHEDSYELYIHISDVSEFIPTDSVLEKEIAKRQRTLYLPDMTIPMLPFSLSEGVLSLLEGELRHAMTFYFKLDAQFKILLEDVFLSTIKVDHNYTYDFIDELLKQPSHKDYEFFNELYEMCHFFQVSRVEGNKGIEFLFAHINAKVVNEKEITLKIYDASLPSAMMIKELMIKANELAALFCDSHYIPFLFLNQEAPHEDFDIPKHYIQTKKDQMSISKYMRKSFFATENIGHFALGLKGYTQITSPIRRYFDVVLQRQLKYYLKNKTILYKEDELLFIQEQNNLFKKNLNSFEDEWNKYYLLKYLLVYCKNETVEGIVLKDLGSRNYVVQLNNTAIRVKVNSAFTLSVFDEVKINLHTVIPRIGVALGEFLEKI